VEGLGGIRKARTADPSRKNGKRGAFGISIFILSETNRLHCYIFRQKRERGFNESGQEDTFGENANAFPREDKQQ
jgi:hypothetical protein